MDIALGAALAILGAVVGTLVLELIAGRRWKRQWTEERLRRLRGLRAETAENSVLDTSGSWRKAPFATDAWEEAKGVLADVEPEVEDTIRQAYVRVRAPRSRPRRAEAGGDHPGHPFPGPGRLELGAYRNSRRRVCGHH